MVVYTANCNCVHSKLRVDGCVHSELLYVDAVVFFKATYRCDLQGHRRKSLSK